MIAGIVRAPSEIVAKYKDAVRSRR
jgi:hypothetical protein